MANKKRFKRIIVFSDSEDSMDEDFHQSHPPKKLRLPDQREGEFKSGEKSRDPDLVTSFPSCSNDIYSSADVIVISDDDDDSTREETSSGRRLRASDYEAADAPDPCGSPVIVIDSDDDDSIITPSSPMTDTDSSESWERPASEERITCNIKGCFLEDITSPSSPYVIDFQNTKHELVTRLFQLYNSTVFENKLPESVEIVWSKRLTATSAFCVNICQDGDRHSKIKLSEKVCDSAERLRDTLAHEMCHVACWHIDGVQNDGHGPLWASYTQNVAHVHPELPPVSLYHNYTINYTYNYECESCEFRVGRFTRLNNEKSYCRKCGGKLLLTDTT